MTAPTNHTELKRIARIAGVLYLVLFFAGLYAEFFVRAEFIVAGDPAATAANITGAEAVFRGGIVSDLVMIVSDVSLAILFYLLVKPVNQALALLAAFFRLAQATILGLNLLNIFIALELLSGAPFLAGLGSGQAEALALVFLTAHGTGYALGLLFFAVNLFILGYLIYKSGYLPRVLGIALYVAAAGYLLDTVARTALTNYEQYAPIFDMAVFTPAVIAELALILWLLIKGVSTPKAAAAEEPAAATPQPAFPGK